MIARGWLDRAEVEAALIEAMHANGYVDDDGIKSAEATLRSGLDAGEQEPHPGLADQWSAPEGAPGDVGSSTSSPTCRSTITSSSRRANRGRQAASTRDCHRCRLWPRAANPNSFPLAPGLIKTARLSKWYGCREDADADS